VRHASTDGDVLSDSSPDRRAARSKDLSDLLALRHSSSCQALDGRRRQVVVVSGTCESSKATMTSSIQTYETVAVELCPCWRTTVSRAVYLHRWCPWSTGTALCWNQAAGGAFS